MSNQPDKLYSPAKIAEQFSRKPGYHIFGSPDWNSKRDKMTLAEVRNYDDENHRLILKESKEYRFNTFTECAGSKFLAYAWALAKLGSKTAGIAHDNPKMMLENRKYFDKKINQECIAKGIRREERPPRHINVEHDRWKSGMYVYYHGDIVYFISNPMKVRAKEGSIYLANRVQFMIKTNARVE